MNDICKQVLFNESPQPQSNRLAIVAPAAAAAAKSTTTINTTHSTALFRCLLSYFVLFLK